MDDAYVRVKCDCGCATLEFRRIEWDDGDVMYDASILDSRYDHNVNGLLGRIRRAMGVMVGKPVYFNDVTMSEGEFDALLEDLHALRQRGK